MKCDEKELKREKSFEPESPYVIVCEGFQDSGFICALLKRLGITNCDVAFPKKRRDGANGKGGIAQMVGLLKDRKLDGVAVIRDADDDPADALLEAQAAFSDPYSAPAAPFLIEQEKNRTGIFLIPGNGKTGTLDDLLFSAIAAPHRPAIECVETFHACSAWTAGWTNNKKAKMKMHSLVAAVCQDDPGCSLGFIWSKGADNPVDISSPVLKELADFLKAFSTP